MDVARVKAVRDAAVGLVQRDRVSPRRPVAGSRPLIEPKTGGRALDAVLGALVA
jgi:hypothetical protein